VRMIRLQQTTGSSATLYQLPGLDALTPDEMLRLLCGAATTTTGVAAADLALATVG